MAWIAFIDESGDHGMLNIDPASPMFALTAAIYDRVDYIDVELPSVATAKMTFWPSEGVVFRAHDIKKKVGPFSICADPAVMAALRAELCAMFHRSPVTIISAVIDKLRHKAQYVMPDNPYFLCVQFVLERIHMMAGDGTTIIFESRGKKEDALVAGWCQRVCDGENARGHTYVFDISFAKKSANIAGLQVADLACQPIIHYVNNRATTRADCLAVLSGVRTGPRGKIDGFGLKTFPR